MLRPLLLPAVMPSAPTPPMTMSSPAPAWIWSSPPTLVAVLLTCCQDSLPAKVRAKVPASPLSPRIRSLPPLLVMRSAPVPPMTMLSPAPTSMVSSPPWAVCVERTLARRPAASKLKTPLSPSTRSLPAPLRMVSPPWPPMMSLTPSPARMVSAPPLTSMSVGLATCW